MNDQCAQQEQSAVAGHFCATRENIAWKIAVLPVSHSYEGVTKVSVQYLQGGVMIFILLWLSYNTP
jgi:hypothetical protein